MSVKIIIILAILVIGLFLAMFYYFWIRPNGRAIQRIQEQPINGRLYITRTVWSTQPEAKPVVTRTDLPLIAKGETQMVIDGNLYYLLIKAVDPADQSTTIETALIAGGPEAERANAEWGSYDQPKQWQLSPNQPLEFPSSRDSAGTNYSVEFLGF